MEKLKKAYEAIEMLQSLGLPVSSEQLSAVQNLEREYLRDEIIPLIKQELEPMIENMKNKFQLEVKYSKETGLDINLIERQASQERLFQSSEVSHRQKKYIIRVIFPDNHVSCKKMVWETLMDVVKYAGAEKVRKLNISIMGDNLVSSELNENERYRVSQKEVEPNLYVCTYSSTDTKYEQIKTINRELNLGLKVEKVMLADS